MCTRCLFEFSVMWVTKLLTSPVKKRIFCPKTTKFGPKLAFLVNLDQAMQAYSVPCWWVVWWLWRAGCISQDTYLLYVLIFFLYLCIVVIVTLILALFFGNINHDENDEDSLLLLAFIQTTFQELFSKMDQNADG